MAPSTQWVIDVNTRWCKKCGLCAGFCPRKALLEERGAPKIADPSLCTGCLMCEMHCPDFAITVRRNEQE